MVSGAEHERRGQALLDPCGEDEHAGRTDQRAAQAHRLVEREQEARQQGERQAAAEDGEAAGVGVAAQPPRAGADQQQPQPGACTAPERPRRCRRGAAWRARARPHRPSRAATGPGWSPRPGRWRSRRGSAPWPRSARSAAPATATIAEAGGCTLEGDPGADRAAPGERRARPPGRRTPRGRGPGPRCWPPSRCPSPPGPNPRPGPRDRRSPRRTAGRPLARAALRRGPDRRTGRSRRRPSRTSEARAAYDVTTARYAVATLPAAAASRWFLDHQAAPPATRVASAAASTPAHSGGSSSSTRTSPPSTSTAGARVPTTWVASRRPPPTGNRRTRQSADATIVRAATTERPRGGVVVLCLQDLTEAGAAVEVEVGEHVPRGEREPQAEEGDPDPGEYAGAQRPHAGGERGDQPQGGERGARDHQVPRGLSFGLRAVDEQDQGAAGRTRRGPDGRRRGHAAGGRRRAPRSAAATSGQPCRSDHHAAAVVGSRARSQPIWSRTSQVADGQAGGAERGEGQQASHGQGVGAISGIATVQATAGSAANQALVEASTSPPAAAVSSAPSRRPTGWLRAHRPDTRPQGQQGDADQRAGAAPAERVQTQEPRGLGAEQVDGEHAGHHQPERLRGTAQVLAGQGHGHGGQDAGEAEQHQRSSGQAQQAPRDRDEHDRGDQQAEPAERQQHHGNRGGRQAP